MFQSNVVLIFMLFKCRLLLNLTSAINTKKNPNGTKKATTTWNITWETC